MKNFLKTRKIEITIFVIISLLFWAVRLWKFELLMTFYSDQALFMEETYDMVVNHKLRLIGPIVLSKVTEGKSFFTGPLLYYLLTPLGLVTNWNIVLMSKIFMGVWWLMGLTLFVFLTYRFSWLAGLSTYTIYSVFPYFLNYNRFIWNLNIIPFLSTIFYVLVYQIYFKPEKKFWFLNGIIIGLALNLHYGSVLLLLMGGMFWFYGFVKKRWTVAGFVLLLIGLVLAELPILVFELRHNFYNLRTILFVLQRGESMMGNSYHLAVIFLPALFLIWGFVIRGLSKTKSILAVVLSFLVFTALAISINWKQTSGLGIPQNWNYAKQLRTVKLICEDYDQKRFEVAAVVGGDTRATDLRWLLKKSRCLPMGVEEYPQADLLYLVAQKSRPPERETVWEVKSLRPFSIEETVDLGDDIFFYKLIRQKDGKEKIIRE